MELNSCAWVFVPINTKLICMTVLIATCKAYLWAIQVLSTMLWSCYQKNFIPFMVMVQKVMRLKKPSRAFMPSDCDIVSSYKVFQDTSHPIMLTQCWCSFVIVCFHQWYNSLKKLVGHLLSIIGLLNWSVQ